MDRKPRILNYRMQIAIISLLLCTTFVRSAEKKKKIVPTLEEREVYAEKGDTVLLRCQYSQSWENLMYTWTLQRGQDIYIVAINNTWKSNNYKVSRNLRRSYYNLEIKNVSFEHNNGTYSCKWENTKINFYSRHIDLVVLRAPSPPLISLSSPTAIEGQKFEMKCDTYNGNPEPKLTWYRGNSSLVHTGKTLVIEPTWEDHGTSFRCVVTNRAMPDGKTLEASVTLDVNYFPRVTVGPENPLKIEVNSTATLNCYVDANPQARWIRWIWGGQVIATNSEHVIRQVTLDDVGNYTCQANNGLEKWSEASLVLDVLYSPTVSIEGDTLRVVDVEDSVTIHCNVSANPMPFVIEWQHDGRPKFRQATSILRLIHVAAEHAGNYTCHAVNTIHPTGGERRNHSAFASVTIRVRHKPGPARMTSDLSVAVEGSRVIFTCMASPAGYPEPNYNWWKKDDNDIILIRSSDPKYEIESVHLGSEGTYKCQASNKLGLGEAASINLMVYQPPKILIKLQPHATRRVGESSLQVSCVAQGKPRPNVRWLKDDQNLTADERLYKVETTVSEGHGSIITVNSTLSFLGHARPQTDEIMAGDRGKYTCVFANEVKKVESTMILKVEHEPIVLHQHGKVAYNLRETAEVACKVQAWPKPEFKWSFGVTNAAILQGSSSDGHYELSTTNDDYDVYTSVLRMTIHESDYGDYTCHAINAQGNVTSIIRLQPKGAPEKPTKITVMEVGATYIALLWQLGFDGGLPITKYFVSYKRVIGDNKIAPDCAPPRGPVGKWLEFDCHQMNPCNITNLEQYKTYTFKVKIYNTKNHSDYSDEVTATTVAEIPKPLKINFDPEISTLAINVDTCLILVAFIEKFDENSNNSWRIIHKWLLEDLGSAPIQREGVLNDGGAVDSKSRLRVKLCLKADLQKCGEYAEAEIGRLYTQLGSLGTPTLIALIVSGVFLLSMALLLLFCRCRRKHATYPKDSEMDSNVVQLDLAADSPYDATTATQLDLPTHSPHRAMYDVDLGRSPSLLLKNSWNRHAYSDLDGAPAPVTFLRIDESGLPVETYPRPYVGAKTVHAPLSLQFNRFKLLEIIPEARGVDQLEEHNGGANMLNEAAGMLRGETLKMDAG